MAHGSVIGPGTVVRGNVRGEGPLEILGRVEGDVAINGDVSLGEQAAVRGNITGAQITVVGRVLGDLSGSEAVLIEAGARVAGDVVAPRIGIGNGALIRGNVRTEGEPSLPVAQRRPTVATLHRLPQRHMSRPLEGRVPEMRVVDSKTGEPRVIEARSSEMRSSESRSEIRPQERSEPGAVESRAGEPKAPEARPNEGKRSESTGSEEAEARPAAMRDAAAVARGNSDRQPPAPVVPSLPKGAQAKKKKSRRR